MDPTSTVRTDALPAIATVVIPGALAISPLVWLLLSTLPDFQFYLTKHDGQAALLAALTAIAAGFVIESVGSYVEVFLIDKRRADHEETRTIWWRYLQIVWCRDREPIGQRYLRRLLITFKFELNMFIASICLMLGAFVLRIGGLVSWNQSIAFAVVLSVIAGCFFIVARDSSNVLAEVRKKLVEIGAQELECAEST